MICSEEEKTKAEIRPEKGIKNLLKKKKKKHQHHCQYNKNLSEEEKKKLTEYRRNCYIPHNK